MSLIVQEGDLGEGGNIQGSPLSTPYSVFVCVCVALAVLEFPLFGKAEHEHTEICLPLPPK